MKAKKENEREEIYYFDFWCKNKWKQKKKMKGRKYIILIFEAKTNESKKWKLNTPQKNEKE